MSKMTERVQFIKLLRNTVDVALDSTNKEKAKQAIYECIKDAEDHGIGYKTLFMNDDDFEQYIKS